MIKQENTVINNITFIKTYSTDNKIIRKLNTEEEYTEAFDLESYPQEYEERDKIIQGEEENAN